MSVELRENTVVQSGGRPVECRSEFPMKMIFRLIRASTETITMRSYWTAVAGVLHVAIDVGAVVVESMKIVEIKV